MIKKILFSICVLFSFFLMFLFGLDKINVLAYSDIGNALGSYPVKLDIDNYNTYQLVNAGEMDSDIFNFNAVKSFTFTDYGISLITSDNYAIGSVGTYFNPTKFENVEIGKTYTLSFDITYNNYFDYFKVGNERNLTFSYCNSNSRCNYTFVAENIYNYVIYGYDANSTNVNNTFTIDNFMIYEGEYDLNKTFGTPFKFGYNVNYSLAVNNLTSSQVNAGIAITDSSGNYLKTGSCVIPAGSSTICSNINEPLYLPFNIDNNGYISFNYSLGLFIGPVGSLSVTPSDSGLNFVPVFSAYYKGEFTNNLYFKDRYTFNNLFLSGFNVSVNSSTLSRVIFPRTQVDSEYSMNSNKIVNFATDKKIETGIYNYINYVDFINSSPNDIYSFVITTGVSSPGLFNNRIYTISFSNFSLKVNGDSSNSSPLPNNPSTINKYNECSAWYDIPCQLGNGLTYVIYEAPIISPVLTFIVSFITMFSSLVSFVDLFRSFGIVFGCFIIYMFIELLHKYSK